MGSTSVGEDTLIVRGPSPNGENPGSHTHTQKTRMKTLRQYDTVIHEMAPLVYNVHDPIGCSGLASVGFRTFLDSDMF